MNESDNNSGRLQNLSAKRTGKSASRTHGFVVDKRVAIAIGVAAVLVVLVSIAFSTGVVGKPSRTVTEEAAYQREKHRDEDGADAPDAQTQPNTANTPQKGRNSGD